jgi:hypothetical protein
MTWLADLEVLCKDHGADDEAPGAEMAPGVLVERRAVLWLPLAAAAAFLWKPPQLNAAGEKPPSSEDPGRLTWDEFLRRSVPVAKEMFKDASPEGKDAYLLRIASLAVRLQGAPKNRLGAFGGLKPKVEFGPSYRGLPFFIIQWRMEPHAILPAHCHPQASVCTVGLEGEARLRNFEVEGDAPAFNSGSKKSFHIRETHSQVIGPRRVSTLAPSRDNIHYFEVGPEGARGLDITTMYGGTGDFSFVAFEPNKPKDPVRRIFEASWTGRKP